MESDAISSTKITNHPPKQTNRGHLRVIVNWSMRVKVMANPN